MINNNAKRTINCSGCLDSIKHSPEYLEYLCRWSSLWVGNFTGGCKWERVEVIRILHIAFALVRFYKIYFKFCIANFQTNTRKISDAKSHFNPSRRPFWKCKICTILKRIWCHSKWKYLYGTSKNNKSQMPLSFSSVVNGCLCFF